MVTLMVPTLNRPEFVIRMLRHYARLGFKGRITIGDSSTSEHVERTRQAILELRGALDVVHVPMPGLGLAACLQRLANLLDTPYATILPDDDFVVPGSLDRCIQFLEQHADYAAAHGAGLTVTLDSNALYGNVVFCAPYPQPAIEADRASERLRDHLGHYKVSLFAVHRAAAWRTMMRDVHLMEDVSFAAELLPCCWSVVLGKIKELEGLYLVRQSHNLRLELPTMFDWIATRVWFPSYEVTVRSLADALVQQEQIAPDTARAVVKDGFREYIGFGLGLRRRWGAPDWVVGVARQAQRLVQLARPKPDAQWALPSLLSASSPHHKDFMPIYQALVTAPADAVLHAAPPSATGKGSRSDGV
jgi:glycosyltransferase domain-containing protein